MHVSIVSLKIGEYYSIAYLSVDELDIVWALSIAVTGTIFGTGLVAEYLERPPSAAISEKYKAPFKPQGRLETSTSKVNSLLFGLNNSYLLSELSMR